MASKVSDHFTWEELTITNVRDVDNTPGPEECGNLSLLANEQLESVRALWGCGIHINSAFRSLEVNSRVGGAKNSQHVKGCAADIIPLGKLTLRQAYEMIKDSGIVYDQLIFEFGSWVHISRPAHGNQPRRQCLMIGKWTGGKYLPYDGNLIP